MQGPSQDDELVDGRSDPSVDELLARLSTLAVLKERLQGAEREALQAARDEGASLEAIANALGVSRQAVHRRLDRLGVVLFIATPHVLGHFADVRNLF